MVRHLMVVGFAIWALGAPTPLVAQTEAGLDQYQLDGTHNGAVHSANALGQSFTVGENGVLSAVEVAIMPWLDPSAPLEVEIRDVSGGVPGTILDDSVTLWPARSSEQAETGCQVPSSASPKGADSRPGRPVLRL